MVDDLLKGLSTPGVEVKAKILDIVMTSLSSKTADLALRHLQEVGLTEEGEKELVPKVLSLLELITYKFVGAHPAVAQYFFQRILPLADFNPESVLSLSNIFALILRNSPQKQKGDFVIGLLSALDSIISV